MQIGLGEAYREVGVVDRQPRAAEGALEEHLALVLHDDGDAAVHDGVEDARRPPVAGEGEAEGVPAQLVVVVPGMRADVHALLPPRAVEGELLAAPVDVRRTRPLAGRPRVAEHRVGALAQVVRVTGQPAQPEVSRRRRAPCARAAPRPLDGSL